VTTNETPGLTGGPAATSSVIALLDRITDPADQLLAEAKQLADELGVRLIDKDELLKGKDDKNAYDLYEAFWAARRLEEIIDGLIRLRSAP
jgi:hypothetical protein